MDVVNLCVQSEALTPELICLPVQVVKHPFKDVPPVLPELGA